jgi:hypothetical protein
VPQERDANAAEQEPAFLRVNRNRTAFIITRIAAGEIHVSECNGVTRSQTNRAVIFILVASRVLYATRLRHEEIVRVVVNVRKFPLIIEFAMESAACRERRSSVLNVNCMATLFPQRSIPALRDALAILKGYLINSNSGIMFNPDRPTSVGIHSDISEEQCITSEFL